MYLTAFSFCTYIMGMSLWQTGQYPYFGPFCYLICLFALAAIVVTLLFNVRYFPKTDHTGLVIVMEFLGALLIFLLTFELWSMLFKLLWKI
ncbi:MAG: hypothetical protein IJX74_02080 [Clostridia bacterium]|nr:hypothetical protein [Clostridia bacterium]